MKSPLSLIATAFILTTTAAVSAFAPIQKHSTNSPPLPTATRLSATPNPVISVAARGMSLLAPIFKAQAALQANLLSDQDAMAQAQLELAAAKKSHKVLIYTYGLSPFSTQAVALLDESGYPYTEIELGAEWFLLDGPASALRQVLGTQVDNGATSLPKIFIAGRCIGGCAELSNLVTTGELDVLMKKARVVPKRKN